MKNNILIIGFGSSAKRHIKNLLKIKNNIFFFILSRKKKIYLPELNNKNYILIKKLEQVNFDTIKDSFICTGSNEHLKFIKILSKKKINIFVEKPLMDSASKITELKKITNYSKKKIFVGYNLLFNKSLKFLKNLKIKKNTINKISVKTGYYLPYWRKNIDYKSSVSSNKKKGGGVLLELSHEIHYLLWLFGKPLWTSSILEKKSNLEINVEDSAYILLGYKNFSCSIELDFISKKYIRYCQIDTNYYSYIWSFKKNLVKRYKNQQKSKILFKNNFDINQSYLDELKFYFKHTYLKINKYIDYSYNTLSIIEAIKNSSKNKGKKEKIFYKN